MVYGKILLDAFEMNNMLCFGNWIIWSYVIIMLLQSSVDQVLYGTDLFAEV